MHESHQVLDWRYLWLPAVPFLPVNLNAFEEIPVYGPAIL
jgi:hypothetical protein